MSKQQIIEEIKKEMKNTLDFTKRLSVIWQHG